MNSYTVVIVLLAAFNIACWTAAIYVNRQGQRRRHTRQIHSVR